MPDHVLGLFHEAVNGYWQTLHPTHPLKERFASLRIGLEEEIERRINDRRKFTRGRVKKESHT